MLTQHYKMPVTLDHIQNAKPGQFVHKMDGDEEIVGFIDFVSDTSICIMLFRPADLPLEEWDATSIDTKVDYQSRLREIVNEDEEIRRMWVEMIESQIED